VSYFDHVQCPNCGAKFHPESIVSRPAVGMACPQCAGPLEMKSLFGVADPFVEGGDEQTWSLDDLSPNSKERPGWTGPGGYAPDPLKGQLPLGAKQRKKRPPPPRAASEAREEVPWDKGRGEVVRADGEEEEPGGVSALEAMRRMKDQG
jgi:hypothetical protein